jgi:hypothetical protein
LWLQLQPEFWPALFFSAVAKRRLGETEEALDLFAAALDDVAGAARRAVRDGGTVRGAAERQARARTGRRGAAERPQEVRFHAAKVRYLRGLDRIAEAKASLQGAFKSGLDSPELRKLGKALRR